MRSSTKLGAVLLALMAGRLLCQTDSVPVPAPHIVAAEDFLVQVSTNLVPVLINGKFTPPSRPTLQESLGLNDQESKIVNAIVLDYVSKNRVYGDVLRPLRREALFQSIESDEVSKELTRRIENLQNEHAQMVLAKEEEIRIALGASRFQMLEDFLRSQKVSSERK